MGHVAPLRIVDKPATTGGRAYLRQSDGDLHHAGSNDSGCWRWPSCTLTNRSTTTFSPQRGAAPSTICCPRR
ncbi:hypothetical protein QJS66_11135 [Kocuria rhizophila]|nr:hypothetical protein QJS66_11135 [Kocuria rhizophila]